MTGSAPFQPARESDGHIAVSHLADESRSKQQLAGRGLAGMLPRRPSQVPVSRAAGPVSSSPPGREQSPGAGTRLRPSSVPVIQRFMGDEPEQNFSPNPEYTYSQPYDSGVRMRVQLGPGADLTGGSPPIEWPRWWGKVGADTAKYFSSYMVQAHLLNMKLGGPGVRKNLAPMSKYGNRKHHDNAESEMKKEVGNRNTVEYQVEISKWGITAAQLMGKNEAARLPTVAADIDGNGWGNLIANEMSADNAIYVPDKNTGGWNRSGAGWHVPGWKEET